MRQLLNTVFKCLAEVKLVGRSPNFPFLHKIACQPFSSALGPHKPSWVSNSSAVVLVKLKTEFPHSFLVLVLCREVWGFKTLLNEKTEVGEKCWISSKVNGKTFTVFTGRNTWIHGHKTEDRQIVGCVKLGTSIEHKKTSNSHTMPSKLSVCSRTLQKYELKEGELQKFDLLMLMLEQLERSVQM